MASPTARRTLTFVTGNPRKLEEVQAILGDRFSWRLFSQDVDLPELQGEPDEIATEKCCLAAQKIGGPVITEDTCLGFNALNGLPGPYIKWFLKKIGHKGLNNLLAAYDDKSAVAQCTFAFCSGTGQEILLFTGKTPGVIVSARGPTYFGWDPIFQPIGFDKTYAELDPIEKNAISHRSKALHALCEYLQGTGGTPVKKAKTET